MSAPVADIVVEAGRLVKLAGTQGLALRLLGGIAVRLRCPESALRPELKREYKDIDFATPRRGAKALRDLLVAQGYEPNQRFNTMQGGARLLFHDQQNGRQVDVFLGTFEMCHKLDLEPRLLLPGPSLPPSDLLLLKLQIVQLNQKDVTDALTLLLHHEPVPRDEAHLLSSDYIARLCARDWGWHITMRDNLGAVRARAAELLPQPVALLVQSRIDTLLSAMDSAEKSLAWNLRARVGRRKIWYELPEEVER